MTGLVDLESNDQTMRRCLSIFLTTLFVAFLGPSVKAETLTGKVEITSPVRKAVRGRTRKPLRTGRDKREYRNRSKARGKSRDEVRSVVVAVLDLPKGKSKSPGVMKQIDQTFVPFVLPVVVGSRVEFPNDDKIYHGVYSESEAKPFELPQYANGESRGLTFSKPGVVELFCHIHAHMNAYILVLGNEFFSQPEENHTYKITDLPPGKYRVKAWHPRLGTEVKTVEIKAGHSANLDFTL